MAKIASAQEFAKALSVLLRRDVKVKPAAPPPPAARLKFGGLYKHGNGTVLGSVMGDIGFAARSGAALSMIPADVAAEQIRTDVLDEVLRENFAEVLNVLSRSFVPEDDGRVTLQTAVFPPQTMPEPAAATKASASFDVDIAGYGRGTVTLRVLG
jgi:hypothetical protein